MTETITISSSYSGVRRALRWISEELDIDGDTLHSAFEQRMNCRFSDDRQTITFVDDKACWWFKARWK